MVWFIEQLTSLDPFETTLFIDLLFDLLTYFSESAENWTGSLESAFLGNPEPQKTQSCSIRSQKTIMDNCG